MLKQLFIFLGMVAYYWTIIGLPLGGIFILFFFITKDKSKKKRFLKLGVILLAGLPLFILLTWLVAKIFGTA